MNGSNDPRRLGRRAVSVLLHVGLLVALLTAAPAWAANLVVTTLSDADNAADGACSLREAITAANNNANYHECTGTSYGSDTITFTVSGTVTLGASLPPVTDAAGLAINGGNAITISGNDAVRAMVVADGAALDVRGLTFTKGLGTSTFDGCGTFGGGICNRGTLNVSHSTFSTNNASFGGAIVDIAGGNATIGGSTFVGNHANASGGAIDNTDGGILTVTNSTFSGNSAGTGFGGGIINFNGTVTIRNSTFSGNSSTSGGGICNGATLHMINTILANSPSGGDCVNLGTIATNLANLIEDGSCSPALSGDPNLGSLGDNGGPTETHALLAGSPAIDAGDDDACAAAPVNDLDQRGVSRAQGARCDIGAFELVQGTACPSTFDLDFGGTQYADCFRDVLRGGDVDAGPDVGGTDHSSLVFTGSTGWSGATWLTLYDDTPGTAAPGPVYGPETLCADVLFARFNNMEGAGVVALLNEGVGKRGLALVVSDAGNTDLLQLATVKGDPAKKGKLTVLSKVRLKNGIAENVWYRLILTVDPATPRITGKVFTHSVPRDPDSALGVQVGTTLTYQPMSLPAGVTSPGQNGILAQAVRAVVDLSVTNFSNDPALCEPSAGPVLAPARGNGKKN